MKNYILNKFENEGRFDRKSSKYLWIPEMEFLDSLSVNSRTIIYSESLKMEGLSMFAINGGGDFFALKEDGKVVFVNYGSGNSTVYSNNLEDAFFRRILEFSNGQYVDLCTDVEKKEMDEDDADYYTSESEARDLLISYIEVFKGIFNEEKISFMQEISKNSFDEYNEFISDDVLKAMISKLMDGEVPDLENLLK